MSRFKNYVKNYKRASFKRRGASLTNTTIRSAYNYLANSISDIRSMINVETHKHDVEGSFTPTNAGYVQSLGSIAVGDTDTTRTGNSILIKSLFHRHAYQVHPSATATFIRELLVIDTQQISDTTISVTDVLDSASFLAPLNSQTAGRFKVLHDKVIQLSQEKPTSFAKKFKSWKKRGHHIRYNGTAGSDFQKGNIYLIHISNEATNAPTVWSYNRLSFYDN